MVAAQSNMKFASKNRFILEKSSANDIHTAYSLVDLSKKITAIQSKYVIENQKTSKELKSAVNDTIGFKKSKNLIKICIGFVFFTVFTIVYYFLLII
jgi:hypothetical protein